MSGRELDFLIAEKVLGIVCECPHGPRMLCRVHDCALYSRDIGAAWMTVEKFSHYAPVLFKCGGRMMLGEGSRPVGGEWGCRFDCTNDGKEKYIIGYGNTAAEAICRAVLAVVEHESKHW